MTGYNKILSEIFTLYYTRGIWWDCENGDFEEIWLIFSGQWIYVALLTRKGYEFLRFEEMKNVKFIDIFLLAGKVDGVIVVSYRHKAETFLA